MSYVPSRRVTHYFVQKANVNPLGRQTGWITLRQYDDEPIKAKQFAKDYRTANPGAKVRIINRPGVSGGYTSLR